MKVLITGGFGFIGSNLAKYLHNVQNGIELTILDNLSYGHEDNLRADSIFTPSAENKYWNSDKIQYRFLNYDLEDLNVFCTEKFDIVFHAAGLAPLPINQSDPYQSINVNLAGTVAVLEHARNTGTKKIVNFSSSSVYENTIWAVKQEDLFVEPPTLIYPLTKYWGEQLCNAYVKSYDMDITSVRVFNCYGPQQDLHRQSPALVGYIIRELLDGKRPFLHGTGEQKRDYIYVEDLCRLLYKVAFSDVKASVVNACSGTQHSVNEIYQIIIEEMISDIKPIYRDADCFWESYPKLFDGPYPLLDKILNEEVNKNILGSNALAKRLYDWTPEFSIQSGLKKTVELIKNG